MDINIQSLYLSALSSNRVEIKGPDNHTFLVPCDLVYKRSEYVRNTIQWSSENEGRPYIDFTETPVRTLEQFVVWIYAAEPTLSGSTYLNNVVELAIFGDIYSFEALHNQALDLLREKLGKGVWKLQPDIVKRVYEALHADTPLRRLFRVLLNTAIRAARHSFEQREEMNLWASVFETSSEIGRDYYLASCESYSASQVSSGGPCQYHWHRDTVRKDLNHTGDTVCPLALGATFTDWHKFTAPGEPQTIDAATISIKLSKKEKKEKKRLKKARASLFESEERVQSLQSAGENLPQTDSEVVLRVEPEATDPLD